MVKISRCPVRTSCVTTRSKSGGATDSTWVALTRSPSTSAMRRRPWSCMCDQPKSPTGPISTTPTPSRAVVGPWACAWAAPPNAAEPASAPAAPSR